MHGPLNTARSRRGWPVYVQAGFSEDGRTFAAQFAEAIFTAHQTVEGGRAFYADIKKRGRRLGRDSGHIRVLPGLSPIIGATQAEAERSEQEIDNLCFNPTPLWNSSGACSVSI